MGYSPAPSWLWGACKSSEVLPGWGPEGLRLNNALLSTSYCAASTWLGLVLPEPCTKHAQHVLSDSLRKSPSLTATLDAGDFRVMAAFNAVVCEYYSSAGWDR
jgi:hypothetical protein